MNKMPNANTTRWPRYFIYFFVISCLFVIHVRLYHYAFDDAYIHFRVARNLFETGYPYYNANEIIKVSTSSGWIVFLTLLFSIANLFKIDNNFPLIVSIVNALISLWGMYVYTKIVEILLDRKLSIFGNLLFQLSFLAILLPSSIGLMETPLSLLVAGLGIYFLLHSNPWGFTLLGFAVYLRLELSILFILASLVVILQKQFRLHQIVSYSALGLIPLVIFDLFFYHTVVPHSIIAKSKIYSLSILVTLFIVLFYSLPSTLHSNPIYLASAIITILSAFIVTGWTAYRKRKLTKSLWPLLFFLWSLGTIALYLYAHTFVFGWYIPLFMVPILVACFAYLYSTDYPSNIIKEMPLLLMFLLSAISILSTINAAVNDPSSFDLFESGMRVKTYLMVGKVLYEEYPNATLLTSEIGGLGYSYQGKILDAAGLASSEALVFHPMKVPEQRPNGFTGAIPPEYVKLTKPDIIVSFDIFTQALLNDDIMNQYSVIKIPLFLPEDAKYSKNETLWDNKYLSIYFHNTLPISKQIFALSINQ